MAGNWSPRQCNHCIIWYGQDGLVIVGCAHCPSVSKRLDLSETYDEDLLRRQVAASREAHAKICNRSIQ